MNTSTSDDIGHPDFALKMYQIYDLLDKYDMVELKNSIVNRFTSDWPTTLDEWRQVDRTERSFCFTGFDRSDWPTELLPEPMSAARLALKLNNPPLIASTFYYLYKADSAVDWDNPKPNLHPLIARPKVCFPSNKGARWGIIVDVHVYQLLHRLGQFIDGRVSRELTKLYDLLPLKGNCSQPITCRTVSAQQTAAAYQDITSSRDPLPWICDADTWSILDLLCDACQLRWFKAFIDMGQNFWVKMMRFISDTTTVE